MMFKQPKAMLEYDVKWSLREVNVATGSLLSVILAAMLILSLMKKEKRKC